MQSDDQHQIQRRAHTPSPHVGWQAPLIDLIYVLIQRWKVIVITLSLCMTTGLVHYLSTASFYKSSAVAILLSREKPVFDVSIDSGTIETSQDGARRETTGTLMLPSETSLYLSLLESRPVLQALVDRFALRLPPTITRVRSEELILQIKSMIKIEDSDEGLITVITTAHDPELAADLANAVVKEGERVSKAIEKKLILQQAGYIQKACQTSLENLHITEKKLKDFTATHSVMQPEAQASDRMRQMRDISMAHDKILCKIANAKNSYKENSPQIQRLRAELEVCNKRFKKLNAAVLGKNSITEFGPLMVDYEGLLQQIRLQRDLYISLSAQADVFRIRAEQPAGSIAIIRPATAAILPAGPSRKKYFGISLGLGLFFSLGLAIIVHQGYTSVQDPYILRRVRQIKIIIKRLQKNMATIRLTRHSWNQS